MTKQELWTKIKENDGQIADLIFGLNTRWHYVAEECKDINDYLKAIQKKVPEAFRIHKQPFGITAKCEDGNLQITVKSGRNYLMLQAKSV